ncbi:hypothetical protein KUCAC02_029983, partial [Chaenocephalus aceratus]
LRLAACRVLISVSVQPTPPFLCSSQVSKPLVSGGRLVAVAPRSDRAGDRVKTHTRIQQLIHESLSCNQLVHLPSVM